MRMIKIFPDQKLILFAVLDDEGRAFLWPLSEKTICYPNWEVCNSDGLVVLSHSSARAQIKRAKKMSNPLLTWKKTKKVIYMEGGVFYHPTTEHISLTNDDFVMAVSEIGDPWSAHLGRDLM